MGSGRVGLQGNETAKRAAAEAFGKEHTGRFHVPLRLKPLTAKYIHQVWQKEWDEAAS